MKYQSLENSSVIRKFSVLFLLVSILPFLVLFYMYNIISETSDVRSTIDALQTALILVAVGIITGYWAIRSIFKSFINTTLNSRKDIGRLVEDLDLPSQTEDNEVLILKKTFSLIKTKLEDDIQRLNLSKRTLHSVLDKIGQGVAVTRSLDDFLQLILETLTDALNSRIGVVFLNEKDSPQISIGAISGIDPADTLHKKCPFNMEALGIPAESPSCRILTDFNPDIVKALPFLRTPAIFAPIIVHEQVVGGILICSRKANNQFQEDDLVLINNIALQTAIAIDKEDLKTKANVDSLTQLSNYHHFITMLDYEINRTTRYGGQLGLVIIDVDDFKDYNDTFGHVEANIFLHEFAGIIKKSLRITDIACRYGGDEFVVILPETDSEGTVTVTNRLKSAISTGQFKRKISASIGVKNWESGMNRAQFIEAADKALYLAKEKDKNQTMIA